MNSLPQARTRFQSGAPVGVLLPVGHRPLEKAWVELHSDHVSPPPSNQPAVIKSGFPLPLSGLVICQNDSELRKALSHKVQIRTSPKKKSIGRGLPGLWTQKSSSLGQGMLLALRRPTRRTPPHLCVPSFSWGRRHGCLNLGPQWLWGSQWADPPTGQADSRCSKAHSSRHGADLSVLTATMDELLALCSDLARSPGHFAASSVCRLCVHLSHSSVALSSSSPWPPDPAGVS